MPDPLVVPNAAQLRLIWSLGGQLYALNVLGVVAPGGVAITQAVANTIGAAVKAGLGTSTLGANLHPTVALANVGLRDVRTASQPEYLDASAPVVGTGTGDLLPPQVAIVVTLRTALAGQSYRGRVYLPGFAEGTNSSTGTSALGTAPVNFIAAIKSTLQGNAMDLGVLSRPNADATPPRFGMINVVTSIVMRDTVWDTQRRRAVPGI